MIICDLCGEAKDCLQKEIAGKEYDICPECWNPLARINKEREDEEPGPLPGELPKIWGAVERPH